MMLLAWKVGIAARSYRRRGLRVGSALSTLGGVVFLASLVTGLLWATVGLPCTPMLVLGSWTGLSLHPSRLLNPDGQLLDPRHEVLLFGERGRRIFIAKNVLGDSQSRRTPITGMLCKTFASMSG